MYELRSWIVGVVAEIGRTDLGIGLGNGIGPETGEGRELGHTRGPGQDLKIGPENDQIPKKKSEQG